MLTSWRTFHRILNSKKTWKRLLQLPLKEWSHPDYLCSSTQFFELQEKLKRHCLDIQRWHQEWQSSARVKICKELQGLHVQPGGHQTGHEPADPWQQTANGLLGCINTDLDSSLHEARNHPLCSALVRSCTEYRVKFWPHSTRLSLTNGRSWVKGPAGGWVLEHLHCEEMLRELGWYSLERRWL